MNFGMPKKPPYRSGRPHYLPRPPGPVDSSTISHDMIGSFYSKPIPSLGAISDQPPTYSVPWARLRTSSLVRPEYLNPKREYPNYKPANPIIQSGFLHGVTPFEAYGRKRLAEIEERHPSTPPPYDQTTAAKDWWNG